MAKQPSNHDFLPSLFHYRVRHHDIYSRAASYGIATTRYGNVYQHIARPMSRRRQQNVTPPRTRRRRIRSVPHAPSPSALIPLRRRFRQPVRGDQRRVHARRQTRRPPGVVRRAMRFVIAALMFSPVCVWQSRRRQRCPAVTEGRGEEAEMPAPRFTSQARRHLIAALPMPQ